MRAFLRQGFKPAAIAKECNFGGDLQCGKCVCDPLHFGAFCECSQSDPNGRIGEDRCRPANSSVTDILCFGRGECVCGECRCTQRENPAEVRLPGARARGGGGEGGGCEGR